MESTGSLRISRACHRKMTWMFVLTILANGYTFTTVSSLNSTGNPRTNLAKNLFEDYTPDVIPICDGHSVKVKVGMALRAILDVDEPSQIVSVTVWLRLEWNDCRLGWNTTDFPFDQLVVSSERVWVPDITLFDSTGEGLEKVSHYRPILYPDGKVFFMAPIVITFSCKMDVTYFPYDQQRCKIKFASWSHDGHEMDVTNRSHSADTSFFVDNGEWNLLGMPSRRNVVFYPCCPEPFPDVTFYLVIQRQYLYYFFNLVMPCVLITAISLLVFCLPPESGEKISLGITVLLSLCVFLLMVSERMPATSETIPLIAQYFAATIILASISCGMTVIVLNVHHRGQDDQKVPGWVRTPVIKCLGTILFISRPKQEKSPKSKEDSKESQILNPLLSSGQVHPKNHNHRDVCRADVPAVGAGCTHSERLLEHIYGLLRDASSGMAGQEEQERNMGEWRQVALVLDRLFFIVNTVLVVVVSLVILLRSPSHTDWRDLDDWIDGRFEH